MKSCKSLVIANEVLKGLIIIEELEDCWYHSHHSGGLEPDGFCGYIIHGKCKHSNSTIKVIFYGANKATDTPIRIYILVDGKSKVRDKQLNVEDAIKFIVDKVVRFMS